MNLMDWIVNALIPFLTLLGGGGLGWFLHINAEKRKADSEASQSEAEAFKSLQDVYQQTVDDLKTYCNDIRADRDHLRSDRNELRKENEELREKWKQMEGEIQELRKMIARNGRMVESMRPFMCGKVGCQERMMIKLDQKGESDG